MIGGFGVGPLERKPIAKWCFNDNHLTGINADRDYQGSCRGVILPHGLSDDQRDLILWAWEAGFHQGKTEGVESTKRAFRDLIGAQRA